MGAFWILDFGFWIVELCHSERSEESRPAFGPRDEVGSASVEELLRLHHGEHLPHLVHGGYQQLGT